MRLIHRVHVGNRFCDLESGYRAIDLIDQLVRGYSSLQKEPVKPEDIRLTVHEAPAKLEVKWQTE